MMLSLYINTLLGKQAVGSAFVTTSRAVVVMASSIEDANYLFKNYLAQVYSEDTGYVDVSLGQPFEVPFKFVKAVYEDPERGFK